MYPLPPANQKGRKSIYTSPLCHEVIFPLIFTGYKKSRHPFWGSGLDRISSWSVI